MTVGQSGLSIRLVSLGDRENRPAALSSAPVVKQVLTSNKDEALVNTDENHSSAGSEAWVDRYRKKGRADSSTQEHIWLGGVVHALHPSTQRAEADGLM